MAKLIEGSSQAAPVEFMSTHPSNQTRIKQLTKHLPSSMKLYKISNRPSCVKPKVIHTPVK